jgi:hypothetical protein
MPRVLMPGESDATSAAEKQEAFAMIQQTMDEIMARHNTAFLIASGKSWLVSLAQAWTNILNKVIQVLLLLVNHLVKMQVFNRLRRV